ncbi:uncharacterized protein METZ01_LOCUS75425 [marine metagenome]|uniref:Pyrroloquinoline quinone-dependent pyranose dehydrogenase beta-propeller domain-containing protein n=1 Tax=marine metagenome TaxID=408172 RepID=A0A381U499_9ZZZZ
MKRFTSIFLIILSVSGCSNTDIAMIFHVATGWGGSGITKAILDERIEVAQGYKIELLTENLDGPRFMRFSPDGFLLVASPKQKSIFLIETEGRNRGAQKIVIQDLNRPHSLDFFENKIYIAEQDGILVADWKNGEITGSPKRIISGLTENGNHRSKTVRIGPDKHIYVSMGSTCNVCLEEDHRRGAMMRFNLDGSEPEIYAFGLRNSVGFDWAPFDGAIYATDNGRDLLGDNFPPCELNKLERGGFYGWPFYNGDNISDPDFGEFGSKTENTPIMPVHKFKAHNAPLGLTFLKNQSNAYQDSALVALHGSWNKSERDGYKVVSLSWRNGKIAENDFVSGFLSEGNVIGRPVDVLESKDGSIYISDDYADAIYRVSPSN